MVDFANKKIGGGVLGNGAIQEEILFLKFTESSISFKGDTVEPRFRSCRFQSSTGSLTFNTPFSNSFAIIRSYFDHSKINVLTGGVFLLKDSISLLLCIVLTFGMM